MIDTVTLLKKQKEYEQRYVHANYHSALNVMKCKICRNNCGTIFGGTNPDKPCYCNRDIRVHPDGVCDDFHLDAREARKQGVKI